MKLTVKAPNKELFLKFYKNYQTTTKKTTNIIFDIFQTKTLKITFYNNLTIFFDGELNTKDLANFEILVDKKLYFGSDEVGIGEIVGPIVVCGVHFKTLENKIKQFSLGIIDSKKMSKEKIMLIGKKLIQNTNYTCIVVDPQEFNKMYKKYKNTKLILALLHNKIHYQYKTINNHIIDQFVSSKVYYQYLETNNEQNTISNIKFETKAEEKYLEVAAAAIIAKMLYINWLKKFMSENNLSWTTLEDLNSHKILNNIKENKYKLSKNEENFFLKNWNAKN